MHAEERTTLLASFVKLWQRHSDLRFGQMLREAVGDPAIRHLGELDDTAITVGVARLLLEKPGREPPPGPYWDTEARGNRTFLEGLPRDPARIPPLIKTLSRAWEVHSSVSLGRLVELALEADGVTGDDYRSRLLAIEDGTLRRRLDQVAT